MSDETPADGAESTTDATDEHLRDVPAGSGCTEVWEHLSRERSASTDD